MSPPDVTRTTIHDVARAAGVSSSTVSRAMTGGVVSPATRQAVLAAADRLGYRPNRQAQGLVTGRTGTLGLVVPDLGNPFFADVAKGVSVRARALDIQVFIADTDEDALAELEAIRSLAGGVDGLLVCSPRTPDDELRAVLGAQPTVTIHRLVPGLPSVTADIVGGTHQAIAHLSALGHRHIAYVHGPQASWADAQRTVGLSDGAPQTQITPFGPVAPTFEGGIAVADVVLASGATAVVAYNDLVALGLLNRLAARGVRVPDECSVVGYDDVAVAAMVSPPLTTVQVPRGKAGTASVDLMLRTLTAGSDAAPERMVMATSLVVRGSTGVVPAPGGALGAGGPR